MKTGKYIFILAILAAAFFVILSDVAHCQTIQVDRAEVQKILDENAKLKDTLAGITERFITVDKLLQEKVATLDRVQKVWDDLKPVKTIAELDAVCKKYGIPRDPVEAEGKKEEPKAEKK